MAKKQVSKKKSLNTAAVGEPKFPYTLTPGSLRKLLQQIPDKPKPPKLNRETLQTWGFMNSNDQYNLRVLKAVGLIDDSNVPTADYEAFMAPTTGPTILGRGVQRVYSKLFENFKDPSKIADDELTRFFNINSGGAPETLRLQKETFKALVSSATFGQVDALENPEVGLPDTKSPNHQGVVRGGPTININLHIHLPEGKSKLEYEAIIDRISETIFKKP